MQKICKLCVLKNDYDCKDLILWWWNTTKKAIRRRYYQRRSLRSCFYCHVSWDTLYQIKRKLYYLRHRFFVKINDFFTLFPLGAGDLARTGGTDRFLDILLYFSCLQPICEIFCKLSLFFKFHVSLVSVFYSCFCTVLFLFLHRFRSQIFSAPLATSMSYL